jgi:octaprenyl-diphosphate synthase
MPAIQLTDFTEPIQKKLDEVESIIARTLKTKNMFIQQMVDHLALGSGKRIRPMLAILSAQYCGNLNSEVVTLGAALEMLHVATLIHDDIIDNSPIRRKQKTLNFKWGNEVSVLMGDYVFSSSFYLMTQSLSKDVLKILSDTTNIICKGEISEIFQRFNTDLTEKEYLEIIQEKTASLMAVSCQAAAIISGGSPQIAEALYQFGLNLGIAFQIVDDLLDFSREKEKVGKPVMNDLKEGKLTLPMIHCLNNSTKSERSRLKKIILKKIKNKEDLKFVLRLVEKQQSILYSRKCARDFVTQAQSGLLQLNANFKQTELFHLSDFLIGRDF